MARLLVLTALLAACSRAPDAPPAAPPAAASDASEALPAGAIDESVRPVYGVPKARAPLAERLCDAIYGIAQRARATCCPAKAAPLDAASCVDSLSVALEDGAVSVDEPALTACEQAAAAAFAGCDWVTPLQPAVPEACRELLRGRRARDAACRSALECDSGLTCVGAGPTTIGKCLPPLAAGSPCGGAVDALAGPTRQGLERHGLCAGYCERRQCADGAAIGGACAFRDACGPAARCVGGVCVSGRYAALGEACGAGSPCVAGSACRDERCVALKAAGERCEKSSECRGACVTQADGSKRCDHRCVATREDQ